MWYCIHNQVVKPTHFGGTMGSKFNFITSDLITSMSDDDLHRQAKLLDRQISRMRSHGPNSRDYEVQMCYFQREIQIRKKRQKIHSEYISRRQGA